MKPAKKTLCFAASLLMAVTSMGLNAGADNEETVSSAVGDINSDGVVNVYDASELKKIISEKKYIKTADLNNDGVVDSKDADELYKLILSSEYQYMESSEDGNTVSLSQAQAAPKETAQINLNLDENTDAQNLMVVIEYPEDLIIDEEKSLENADAKQFDKGKATAVFTNSEKLDSSLSSLFFKIPEEASGVEIYEIKLSIVSYGDTNKDFEKVNARGNVIYALTPLATEPTEAITTAVSTEPSETSTTTVSATTVSSSTTPAVSTTPNISVDVSQIENNAKLQWYKSNETEFFRDGIRLYVDGKEIVLTDKVFFNTTPKSTYNSKTFDYVVPFTIEYNDIVIESTFNAKIGQAGDTNLDHSVNDDDIASVISYINYDRDLTDFQKFLTDKNSDGEVDYSDITYSYNNVSYILYSDHAEVINCDDSATSVTIPKTVNKLPVTKISGKAFGAKAKLKSIAIESPDCAIESNSGAINSNTTIFGYPDSLAQVYAEEFGKKFIAIINGDANCDGKINVQDAAIIARKAAQGKLGELPSWSDYNGDSQINIRDAAAIAKYIASSYK